MVQKISTNYGNLLNERLKQAELLHEEIGLLQRMQEIEIERNVSEAGTGKLTVSNSKSKAKPTTVKVEGAKRRGRPPGSKNVVKVDADSSDDGKSVDLQSLLQTIAQETAKPLMIKDFVALSLQSGYTTKAKDFSNIVYQSVLKLVKKGVFRKDSETRAYEFVKDAA